MPPAAETELSRIRRRLVRLPAQREALRLAIAHFYDTDGEFDRTLWHQTFISSDPRTINRVLEVTAGYEGIVNHLMEMLHSGAAASGLDVARRGTKPSAPVLISALAADGCLSANQSQVMLKLNQLRNRLQHASPDVEASDVAEHVMLLLKVMARLVTSLVKWLGRQGIELLAET